MTALQARELESGKSKPPLFEWDGEPCSRRYDPRAEPGSTPDRKTYAGTGIGVLYGQFKHDRHGRRYPRTNRVLRKGGKLQPKSGEQHLWLLTGWTIVGLNELKGGADE